MKRLVLLLTALGAAALLAGCMSRTPADTAPVETESTPPETVLPETDAPVETESPSLFITTDGIDFTATDYAGASPATPETLIAALSKETGWNLDLDGAVVTDGNRITVALADTSCLYQGPPEEQKAAYHVYDNVQMTAAALGSIQKTLQAWANPDAPDSVDIYFCASGNEPLELSDIGELPMDEPYSYSLLSDAMEDTSAAQLLSTQLSNYYDTALMTFQPGGVAEVNGQACAVYEMVSDDGQTVVSRFALSPDQQTIYEWDSTSGSYTPLVNLNVG